MKDVDEGEDFPNQNPKHLHYSISCGQTGHRTVEYRQLYSVVVPTFFLTEIMLEATLLRVLELRCGGTSYTNVVRKTPMVLFWDL
jgi:hypothetical protein